MYVTSLAPDYEESLRDNLLSAGVVGVTETELLVRTHSGPGISSREGTLPYSTLYVCISFHSKLLYSVKVSWTKSFANFVKKRVFAKVLFVTTR